MADEQAPEYIPGKPAWWSRQYIEPFTMDEDEIWRVIREARQAAVSWVTKTCEPVTALMAYCYYDDHIWVTSTPNRHKFQAWKRNPSACLCIWDPKDSFKQLTIRGKVTIFDDEEHVQRFLRHLLELRGFEGEVYDRQYALFNSPNRNVVRLDITRIRSYDGRKMNRAEDEGIDVWGEDWDFPQGR